MIHLSTTGGYKSLKENIEIDLHDFTIITGLNGSGKSQLLQVINSKYNCKLTYNDEILNNTQLIDGFQLAVKISNLSEEIPRDEEINRIFEQYKVYVNHYKNYISDPNTYSKPQLSLESYDDSEEPKEFLEKLAKDLKKDLHELSLNEIKSSYPITGVYSRRTLLFEGLSSIFSDYKKIEDGNETRQFLKERRNDPNSGYLDNEEFIKTHGQPPWIIINDLLKSLSLDYEVNFPTNDTVFKLKFRNTINNAEIDFNDLSSGEKILVFLIIVIYNFSLISKKPRVLLLDEIDTGLNPLMIKVLLKTLLDSFVKTNQLKIILTTHSATTVALADEESLYTMNKHEPRIEKVTKDKALNLLCTGINTFSVNYENRRQVFVESEYDELYYEKLYSRLSNLLNPEISLYFISSGKAQTDINGELRGNCNQVNKIVSILTEAGNKFIRGIIDWDSQDRSSFNANVKVLGKNKRYAIENYILDPLLVIALLIKKNVIDKSKSNINLKNISEFKTSSVSDLQKMVNYCVDRIVLSNPLLKTDDDLMEEIEYVNQIKLSVPKWYLTTRGHTLEQEIKKAFPELPIYIREGKVSLKSAIFDSVINDIPEFIPLDVLILMQELQK